MATQSDNIKLLQKTVGTEVDGQWGPKSRAAFVGFMVNKDAPAIGEDDYVSAAKDLKRPSVGHIKAVAAIESGSSGFWPSGRPKIRFEPHWFSRLTKRKYDVSSPSFSFPSYDPRRTIAGEQTYERVLAPAIGLDANAAFASCSWGRFQVMGFNAELVGFKNAIEMGLLSRTNEDVHLDMLTGFIKGKRAASTLARCRPGSPDSCRPFAEVYNGAAYVKTGYHIKLAEALARYRDQVTVYDG